MPGMPISSKLRERIQRFLETGERIRYVFPAEILGSVSPGVVVVVSQQSITVLSTGIFNRSKPKGVLAKSPRGVRLGPVDTNAAAWFTFNGVHYEVDDEYVPVVNAADAELGSPDQVPQDPLPEL